MSLIFFFFNDPATTEIYTSSHTLSLHDALPTSAPRRRAGSGPTSTTCAPGAFRATRSEEHTSELQSRELISYAVCCLNKKSFFVNAEVSADGNNWSTAAYASDYVEKTVQSQYSDRREDYDYAGIYCLLIRRHPDYTQAHTLFPYTTLFR